MTRDDADQLAGLITRTWRNGPAADVWAGILAEFNYKQADAAVRKLQREAEQSPSIARFIATYKSLSQHDGPDGPNGCHYCDGYGWISTTFERHGHEYSASAACTNCLAGKDAQRTVTWCHDKRGAA